MLRPLTARPGSMGLLDVADDDDDDVDDVMLAETEFVIEDDVVGPLAFCKLVGDVFLDVLPTPTEAFVALAKDSAMAESGGHKFVVCTNPRSK